MSWRVVVISQRCKLDYSMNYMVVRGEETKRVFLDEIAVLIIENTAVSMTAYLLSALVEKKIKVVFCDKKRNPQAELIACYGAHNDSLKIKQQIQWKDTIKKQVWDCILKEKILNQSRLLDSNSFEKEADMLRQYADCLLPGDISNREGHAAKVYFNALFGKQFSRSDNKNPVNAALDYGYSLLLSVINREVVGNGYLTQLGLSHDNQFNHFNLSCDLIEPLRIVVDDEVIHMQCESFRTEEKRRLVSVLTKGFLVQGSKQTLLNSIRIYTKSVFDALNKNDISLIKYVTVIKS